MREAREVILALSVKYGFDWEETYKAICSKEALEDDDYVVAHDYLQEHKGDFITLVDEEYPDVFKLMSKPPFVIILCGKGEK